MGAGEFIFADCRAASRIMSPGEDCFGRFNPFCGTGISGVSSFSGVLGRSPLAPCGGCIGGAIALGCGTGALGSSFFGSGCGGGAGGSMGGATLRKILGSTLTDSWGTGAVLGEGFNDSNVPGGNRTVICRRAISSSSLVRTCGPNIFGS